MIAIQGHPTRGKEIIQILRSLGATSYDTNDTCSHPEWYWYINKNKEITCDHKKSICDYNLYTLEEFERKFPFKIGEIVITTLNHVGTILGIVNNKYEVMFKEDSALIAPRRLKPYKEMERNVTLTLNKAKEWYKKGGELREIALQAFTKEELNPLPRSWGEYCKHTTTLTTSFSSCAKYDAFVKLEHLRDCWWGDWKPVWNASHKYAIKNLQGELTIIGCSNVAAFLVFPTREMAEEFLKCFKDLIELTKDLI